MNTFQPRNGPRFVSESESTGSARPLYYYLYLVAITLTVAAHLGWKAYIESFWHDEAWVAESILLPDVSGMLGFTDPTQITPPLYLFAVRGLVALFGDSEFVFRLVSLFCVIFAFPLCYRFLLQAFQDHRIALAGVACLALSHFATRYGAELKPYSAELLSAFLTLNAFFAGGPWSRDTKSQYHWWIPIAIAAFSLLVMSGAYTSALLFFPALGLRTLEELSGRRWRRGLLLGIGLLLALVVSALFFVFYLQPRTGGAMMQNYWNHAFPSLSRPRELGLSVSLNLFGLFQYYFFQVKALAA
ncbi:MAG: glycosyltransferase family 39 protein, partial [Leptospiraceae bacterium]|nr:glycosyltransferase family 39 protein [Leptospiraceae bacterium]